MMATNSDSSYDESSSDHYDHETEGGSMAGSSTTGTGEKPHAEIRDDQLILAKKETTAIFRQRFLVFSVMGCAAVLVSMIVFRMTTRAEAQEYEQQFAGAAKLLVGSFHDVVEEKFGSLTALSVATMAHGIDHSTQRWPFVTLSSFQQRADTALRNSGALYVHINPLVEDADQRAEWEDFVVNNPNAQWIEEAINYQDTISLGFVNDVPAPRAHFANDIAPWPMWYYDYNNEAIIDDTDGPWAPTWQTSPVPYLGVESNENILANKDGLNAGANITFTSNAVSISQFIKAPPGDIYSSTPTTALIALLRAIKNQQLEPEDESVNSADLDYTNTYYQGDPISKVYFPIQSHFGENRTTVAIMLAWIHWQTYFREILPSTLLGVVVVLDDSCGGKYTYVVDGSKVTPFGAGDLHDAAYDTQAVNASFAGVNNVADGTERGLPLNQDFCPISIAVYPSRTFERIFRTSTPRIMTFVVSSVFAFTAMMFLVYDRLVERRQKLVMRKAIQTNNIVASLFPENVRDRLIHQAETKADILAGRKDKPFNQSEADNDSPISAPIADLFPHCTVLFADIAGFTAWSSTRDPAQVFVLLGTLYQAFDKIAKRRQVFKVETIGDSYLAVTGIPQPQERHAIIMCRFAKECNIKFNELVSKMESTLGPDTGDLAMRIGLHSGPVTAGVLQGDRARFQLFGDTVNTAARMESTGVKGKIQISETTFNLLAEAGKGKWCTCRADLVQAKGKGALRTYFLQNTSMSYGTSSVSGSSESNDLMRELDFNQVTSKTQRQKKERLVDWVSELMLGHLRKLVATRGVGFVDSSKKGRFPLTLGTPLDEFSEVIQLPRFSESMLSESKNPNDVILPETVTSQLNMLVERIANLYRDNPFHNFEHACHVAMSTDKLMKRIVAPDVSNTGEDRASKLHDFTYGITSDQLTLFAILFCALAHDIDHRGISNSQLAKEEPGLNTRYNGKSLAEQNSLDIAWNLLESAEFADLRSALFTTDAEKKRFRQVTVNVVLATDIFDPELNNLRKSRWEKAFSESTKDDAISQKVHDLRATIVIEHIIQASDVAHTMQHWHIYCKWNRRLFMEMYLAYLQGRMTKNPTDKWYEGEINFFDFYVIPLARKLKDCRVFGVSSDECLDFAVQNREEWAKKGRELVQELVQAAHEKFYDVIAVCDNGIELTEDQFEL